MGGLSAGEALVVDRGEMRTVRRKRNPQPDAPSVALVARSASLNSVRKGSRCATRRRHQGTEAADARDCPLVDGLLRRPVSRFARSLCAQRDRPVGLVVTSAFATKRLRDEPPRRRLFRRPCDRPALLQAGDCLRDIAIARLPTAARTAGRRWDSAVRRGRRTNAIPRLLPHVGLPCASARSRFC